EDTIKERGILYLVMVACSLIFLIVAAVVGKKLSRRFGNWNAALIAGGAFVIAIAIVMFILPSLGQLAYNRANYGNFSTETPQPLKDASGNIVFPGFPADVLFNFRALSVLSQLILWTAIGLIFAPMAERVLAPAKTATRVEEPVVG
ncbi:MAG: CbtA family protein, partial [Actinobacteria bacterium]|nr:CbtA family protein [Actinomycetota bacterium]